MESYDDKMILQQYEIHANLRKIDPQKCYFFFFLQWRKLQKRHQRRIIHAPVVRINRRYDYFDTLLR